MVKSKIRRQLKYKHRRDPMEVKKYQGPFMKLGNFFSEFPKGRGRPKSPAPFMYRRK